MGDEEAAQPAGSAAEAEGDRPKPGTKRKARKRASASAADPAAALEARLAAFGEAFMDSIDEPVARRGKKQKPCQDPFGNQGAGARKKKKRRQKSLDAEGTSAGASNTGGTSSAPTSKATAPPAAGAAKGAAKGSAGPAGSSRAGRGAQLAFLGEGPSDGKAAGPLAALRPAPGISKAERRRFMSGKISDIISDKQKSQGDVGGKRGREDPEEDAEFKKTLKQVLDFVTPKLDVNARKQWEEAKIRALGGTVDKRAKLNYSFLQRSQKKKEAERLEKVNQDNELGIVSHAGKHRTVWQVDTLRKKKTEELKERKKRRKQDDVFRLGMGAREKKGLFTIPQREIKSFKRRSGKR